jgi:hypothetical protein
MSLAPLACLHFLKTVVPRMLLENEGGFATLPGRSVLVKP